MGTPNLRNHSLGRVAIFTVIPAPPAVIPPPQPSFRRKPESRARDHLHRHTVPPTVIPAQAGIQSVRSYSPSFRLPQPSFRRKPESRACSHIHRHSAPPAVIPAQAGIQGARSYPPSFRPPQPSFRRKPESRACDHIHRHSDSPSRHSGASRNLCPAVTFTVIPAPPAVIPAQAEIQVVRSYSPSFRLPQPSFRRKPESMLAGSITVVRNYDPGFRRKPE